MWAADGRSEDGSLDGRHALFQLSHLFLPIGQQKYLLQPPQSLVVARVVEKCFLLGVPHSVYVASYSLEDPLSLQSVKPIIVELAIAYHDLRVLSIKLPVMGFSLLTHLQQFVYISPESIPQWDPFVEDHVLSLKLRNLCLGGLLAFEKALNEGGMGDDFELGVLNLMVNEDWHLIADHKL